MTLRVGVEGVGLGFTYVSFLRQAWVLVFSISFWGGSANCSCAILVDIDISLLDGWSFLSRLIF